MTRRKWTIRWLIKKNCLFVSLWPANNNNNNDTWPIIDRFLVHQYEKPSLINSSFHFNQLLAAVQTGRTTVNLRQIGLMNGVLFWQAIGWPIFGFIRLMVNFIDALVKFDSLLQIKPIFLGLKFVVKFFTLDRSKRKSFFFMFWCASINSIQFRFVRIQKNVATST